MKRSAFTIRYNARENAIRNKVGIFLPVTKEEFEAQKPKIYEYFAIWDTGATNSVITKKVVEDLSLAPIRVVEMKHAGGKSPANVYLVNILLPDGVIVPQIAVSEAPINEDGAPEELQTRVLIGMDIISRGDFAITNAQGKTTVSFRIPSLKEVDFIQETVDQNIMEEGNHKQRKALEAMRRKKDK